MQTTVPTCPLPCARAKACAEPLPLLPFNAEREPGSIPADAREQAGSEPAVVHVFWLAGMSCDGCTIGVTGATSPSIEDLLLGPLPGVPRLVLHHPILGLGLDGEFMESFTRAAAGELDAPYVVIYEGSVPDERLAAETGGSWSVLGVEMVDGSPRAIPTAEWLARLAPGAAAVVAIGSCATQGGMPASPGNCTGAMSVGEFLGKDYRSANDLPVVNLNGCPPTGDSFTRGIAAVLRFLSGTGPLLQFEKLGRAA